MLQRDPAGSLPFQHQSEQEEILSLRAMSFRVRYGSPRNLPQPLPHHLNGLQVSLVGIGDIPLQGSGGGSTA